MARIRTLKPTAFSSESLCAVSVDARWTFAGIWTYVDDDGRGRANPRLIKAAVWPLDDDKTPEVIEGLLMELEREGMIRRYAVDGQLYVQVINWHHQKISHPTKSIFPEPPERLQSVPEPIVTAPDPFRPDLDRDRDRDVDRNKAGAGAPQPETIDQRSNRLTKSYTDRVKLSNFAAVRGIVRKAINAGHDDQAIIGALGRLATDGRSVTTDTLRHELDGLPTRASPKPSTTDQRVNEGLALAERLARKELA